MYYAKFQSIHGHRFRFDTRVYLDAAASPRPADPCVGAIIAKNPGSATAGSTVTPGTFGPIALSGDKLLPYVRNRFVEAFKLAGKSIPVQGFVRVWNLIYLCDPDPDRALAAHAKIPASLNLRCQTEAFLPRIVWYAWGGADAFPAPLKARFATSQSKDHFFFDNHSRCITVGAPSQHLPRHTQGLPANPVREHLRQIL